LVRRAINAVGLAALFLAVPLLSAKTASKGPQMSFPPPMEKARTISAEDLLKSAQLLLPKGAFLGPLLDARYTVIKHEWLVGKFIPFYRTAVETLKDVAHGGGSEGADCDDFCIFLRQMTGLAGIIGHTAGPAAAQVLVFQSQEFSGVGRTRERHAVGLFLTERGWFVLEPQNATELVAIDSYANKRGIQYITFH
jgi:hypothetical protein